jgi:hypothetical protein
VIGKRIFIAAFVLVSAPSAAQDPQSVPWDGIAVPITIEVTRDVPVKASQGPWQERGTLYSGADFVIPKGARFRMIERGAEGSCKIEYQQQRFELSSCPWMPGFTDHQSEIYVVVEVASRVN